MNWGYRFDERALKELKKLGRQAQQEILAYLDKRVANNAEPRRFGKALKADLAGLWRTAWGIIGFSARSKTVSCWCW